MPRPRQSTGRPHTPVIPADWETAHRVVASGTLRGTVSVRRPGTSQAWSDEAGQMVAAPRAPYLVDAPARVQQLNNAARDTTAGEDDETVVDYLVVLDHDASADLASGDLVTVTTATDPLLVGRVLTVHHIALGTERFERDLFCTLT